MSVIYTSSVYTKSRKDGAANPKYSYYLTVDIQSQSVVNNTSTVLFTLYMYTNRNGSSEMWDTNVDSYAARSSITVEGETYPSSSNVDQGSNGSGLYIVNGGIREYTAKTTTLEICKETLTIPHNSDGTKSISVSFNWIAGPSSQTNVYYPVSFASNGATVTLTAIPRSGAISAPGSVTVNNTTSNLSYTITSYANYYYNLSYTLDGHSVTVMTRQNINTTTYSGTIAYSWLLANNHLASASLVFTLETWTASSGGTKIGTTTKTVTINISTSTYKPTVTLSSIVPGTTPITGYLLAGNSTASVPYSTTKPSGATGLTVYFTAQNGTMATTSTNTESGSVLTNTLPGNENANYTLTVSAYAKDSRGAISTTVSKTVTVYAYKKPTITATAMRVATNGSTTEDGAGEYVYILYSAAVGASVNSQNTIQSTDCTYNSNSYSSPSWVALQADLSGVFTFTASDRVSTVSTAITVPMALYPLDLYDDGTAQHLGVGLAGAIAEADKVKTAKDFYAPNVFVGSTTDAAIRQVRISTLAGEIKISGDASANGNRGIWVPAHGTGAATDVIKIDKDNNVTFYGSLANAGNATKLDVYPSMRPTSANQVLNDGTLTHFLSSSSMTTGKPASDGHIINCQWDNSNINGVQLYMNHSNAHDQLGLRTSSTSWRAWEYADMRRTVWTGTAQGGTSISANVADYSYIKVYVSMFKVDLVVTVDLTHYPNKTVAAGSSNTTYRGSAAAPVYATGANTQRVETFYAVIEVPSAKTSVSILQLSYYYGTTNTTRNSNADYFAYKIEGYL